MLSFTWQAIKMGDDGPGPRSRHVLVHDLGARATILFGGIVWGGFRQLQSDTWELKDGYWSPVEVSKSPRARHRGAMVFDEERGVSVLFGGQDGLGSMLGDTWTYADRQWQRQKVSWWRRPQPRCGHALAYDEATRQVVLFGGIGLLDRPLGDTWVFDGSSWRKVRGPHPSARRYAAFAYDPDLKGCVLHGGAHDDQGSIQYGDAWLFREGEWTELPSGFDTDARDDHGLAYHRSAKRMVMLDGLGGSRGVLSGSSEGWEWAACEPLHPRHQCSPLAWDVGLDGLVLYGGETHHGGHQFEATLVLRLKP